ncbi:S8 family peptidase [Paenibacillus sp. MWE-103]|uniref:S8 family peptidase n=1 Tax=Paenibacillus artemisiicola TaxID=1172618 RepID=A0ABS3W6T5_9BACL|nr:S8 family peptidase [Paenibacillus artemisiicola]MBO7744021.1 S8 family peptidase [Paenibacillus artemisiicola]
MPKVEKLLLSCSSARSSAHTTRKLIGFKRRGQYVRCMNQLANYGIKPIKSIRRGRLIVCYLDNRRTDKLHSLAAHPDVKFIEPDSKVRAHGIGPGTGSGPVRIRSCRPASPYVKRKLRAKSAKAGVRSNDSGGSAPWNVKQVQAHAVWPSTRGGGVGIGIIDTGIGKNADLYVSGGVNTMGGSSYADDNGHGTHVAGIAAGLGKNGLTGVAPGAKLYAVKALDANGAGYISDLIKGIEWCIKKKIPIINMSLGLEGETSSALKEAVERARKSGIVVVASAGNSGPSNNNGIDQPARYSDAIAVAATTKSGRIAEFSSRGSGIDVAAPGSYIKSTKPGGGYAVMSGTSMSCPHIAGGAALLKALNPSLTPYGVKKRLRASANKLSGYGSKVQGYGVAQLSDAAGIEREAESARHRSKARASARRKKK